MSADLAGSTPDWGPLQRAIAGEIAVPGAPAYDRLPQPFNARYHELQPQAIVLCASPEDVAETILFLAGHRIESAVRSGGHWFAGHSSTRGVVVDVTGIGSVSVSGGVARVGAGARLGPVYDALQARGLAIRAGTCPPVGIAGLALGGGLGILGRTYGVRSCWPTAASWSATSTTTTICSGHCGGPGRATSAWSRRSSSAPFLHPRRPMQAHVLPDDAFWAQLGAIEDLVAEIPEPAVTEPRQVFAKSEFFRRPLPTDAIAALVETLSRGRVAGESRELDFMPWGGAYNRVRPDATAFVHREELFQLKHAAVVDPPAPMPEVAAAPRWVSRSWASVHRWGSGRVFQNFADRDLDNWAHAYYGTNYDRLVRVKARYDPANVFRFHQSLPTG